MMTREEAIRNIERFRNGLDSLSESMLIQSLDMATEALEQTKWIPCSERLPEENGYYLVTGDDSTWVSLWKQETWMSATGLPIVLDGITAWMPLPEAYREENK